MRARCTSARFPWRRRNSPGTAPTRPRCAATALHGGDQRGACLVRAASSRSRLARREVYRQRRPRDRYDASGSQLAVRWKGNGDGSYGRAGCGSRHRRRWATGWRTAPCGRASRRSSGIAAPRRLRILAERGAEVAKTAAEAARRAGIVVTMVTDADAVISVARDQGMLAALAPGAIWVQMSTIGLAGTERVDGSGRSERPDVALLDAPVSGSKEPAEQGQLTIFASGPDEARPRVAPLFDALGQRTIWVGGAGAGTRLKLVNNTWLAFANEAVAASVALARRLGLDTGTVAEAIGGGPLVSPWQAAKLQRIARGEFSAQFAPVARAQGRTPRAAGGWRRSSRCLPAWRTNGSRSSTGARRPGPDRRHARARAAAGGNE